MPLIQVGGHRRNTIPLYAEIDEEDFDKVKDYKWIINHSSSPHTKYAYSKTGGKKVILHRLIMGLGDYKEDKRIIDHKDGNGLNNKKENLTICDILYNSQSFRSHHGNRKIGIIYYDNSMKRIKRWKAQIIIMGKRHQKRFMTEEEGKIWLNDIFETNK